VSIYGNNLGEGTVGDHLHMAFIEGSPMQRLILGSVVWEQACADLAFRLLPDFCPRGVSPCTAGGRVLFGVSWRWI